MRQIEVSPSGDVGLVVGSSMKGLQHFIGFEGAHDIATGRSGRDRFLVLMDSDDVLWMIQSLANELPTALHDEAIELINDLGDPSCLDSVDRFGG